MSERWSWGAGRGRYSWLVLTALTLVFWGAWGLVSKPLANALSAWQVQALSSLGMLPVISLLARRGVQWGRGVGLAFGSGLICSLGNVAFYEALAAGGKAAAVTPLTALYPLVTIGLALIFLRERLSLVQAIGAALSLAAMYCFNAGAGTVWLTPWLAVALIPILLWGVGALLQKLATDRVSAEQATAAFLAGELPLAFLIPVFVPMQWNVPMPTWFLLLLLGLLFALGNWTLTCAYGAGGRAAIVTPLASLYSLVTIPLAVLWLGEHLSAQEGIGIVLALAAAVALAWEPSKPTAKNK